MMVVSKFLDGVKTYLLEHGFESIDDLDSYLVKVSNALEKQENKIEKLEPLVSRQSSNGDKNLEVKMKRRSLKAFNFR
jgi:hypothetical protein